MCTAATYKTKDFYFGRTLDYEFSYGDEITITPRNYEIKFRHQKAIKNHYAIIGMAYVTENYPLYYDAINEKGLCIAGLNFVGNAHYNEQVESNDNIAQFEFIPWILSQCTTVKEAKKLPTTGESLALFIVLAVISIVATIVYFRVKKLKNENTKN